VYIRKTTIQQGCGKIHHYGHWWSPIARSEVPGKESFAWLGEMDEAGRLGVERVAEGTPGFQQNLFEKTEPEWVEIDVKRVRV